MTELCGLPHPELGWPCTEPVGDPDDRPICTDCGQAPATNDLDLCDRCHEAYCDRYYEDVDEQRARDEKQEET